MPEEVDGGELVVETKICHDTVETQDFVSLHQHNIYTCAFYDSPVCAKASAGRRFTYL